MEKDDTITSTLFIIIRRDRHQVDWGWTAFRLIIFRSTLHSAPADHPSRTSWSSSCRRTFTSMQASLCTGFNSDNCGSKDISARSNTRASNDTSSNRRNCSNENIRARSNTSALAATFALVAKIGNKFQTAKFYLLLWSDIGCTWKFLKKEKLDSVPTYSLFHVRAIW